MNDPAAGAADATETRPASITSRLRKYAPWLGALLVCVLVGAWLMAPLVRQHLAKRQARILLREAAAHESSGQIKEAMIKLAGARHLAPAEPEVLRAIGKCVGKQPGAAALALHYSRELLRAATPTEDDLLQHAELCLANQSIEEAEKTAGQIAPERRSSWRFGRLQAGILAQKGRVAEAENALIESCRKHPEEPEARARLCSLEVHSPFAEMRTPARQELWTLAATRGEPRRLAWLALAELDDLSTGEIKQLIHLALPNGDASAADGYELLVHLHRARPEALDMILDDLGPRIKKAPMGSREHYYMFLSRVGKVDLMLADADLEEVRYSRMLYIAYADALVRTKNWTKLTALLATRDRPISAVDFELLSAFAAQGAVQSSGAVQAHLKAALLTACKRRDPQQVWQVVNAAEVLACPEIASEGLDWIAALPGQAGATWERMYAAAFERRDAAGMLRAVQGRAQTAGQGSRFHEEADYLSLLTGVDLESTLSRMGKLDWRVEDSPVVYLTRAMAAYTAGDRQGLHRALKSLGSSEELSPGQRAVLAGLWRADRDPARAHVLSENVSSGLILPEERWFLNCPLPADP